MNRIIVVPGTKLNGNKIGKNVFTVNQELYSEVLGFVSEKNGLVNVNPFKQKYLPVEGDIIIAIVVSSNFNSVELNINSCCNAFSRLRNAQQQLKPGTIVSAKVLRVNELNEAELIDLRVFFGGNLIKAESAKIPRIIGKNSSMLNNLKEGTKCKMFVGRNGFIWVKDGNISLLLEALDLIEREAHLSNLTEKVKDFLKQKLELISNEKRS